MPGPPDCGRPAAGGRAHQGGGGFGRRASWPWGRRPSAAVPGSPGSRRSLRSSAGLASAALWAAVAGLARGVGRDAAALTVRASPARWSNSRRARAGPDRPRAARRGRAPHLDDRRAGRDGPADHAEHAADGRSGCAPSATPHETALTEMRRLLGVLREDADDERRARPQPGLAQLNELLDEARDAGAGSADPQRAAGRSTPAWSSPPTASSRRRSPTRGGTPRARRSTSSWLRRRRLRLRVRDNGPGPAGSVAGAGTG